MTGQRRGLALARRGAKARTNDLDASAAASTSAESRAGGGEALEQVRVQVGLTIDLSARTWRCVIVDESHTL